MFTSSNIVAFFKKGTLKLAPNADGDLRRFAEATLVIEPFSAELAHELGEDIAGHLFDHRDLIRDELESIDLRVGAGLQPCHGPDRPRDGPRGDSLAGLDQGRHGVPV